MYQVLDPARRREVVKQVRGVAEAYIELAAMPVKKGAKFICP
jgi:hypothetical protein